MKKIIADKVENKELYGNEILEEYASIIPSKLLKRYKRELEKYESYQNEIKKLRME